MIPVLLSLRNFLSYGEAITTIDFRGKRLLCLTGENGHGKSALLDAMTWALFGRARSQRDSDLLHYGAREMWVRFEWRLAGRRYRIDRRLTLRAQSHTTSLELFGERSADEWIALGGTSLRETQGIIQRVLGMNYETFINSAFLLQGRADEFTVKIPSERKKVLADILNLGVYEHLSEQAKESRNTWRDRREQIDRELRRIDTLIAELPALEDERNRQQQVIEQAESKVREAAYRLELIRADWQRVEKLQEEQRQLEDRLHVDKRLLVQTEAQMEREQRTATELRGMLQRREAIEQRYEELLKVRREREMYHERLQQSRHLGEQLAGVEKVIHAARVKLEERIGSVERELNQLQREILDGKRAAERLQELVDPQERIAALDQEAESLWKKRSDLSNRYVACKQHVINIEQAREEMRKRYLTLRGSKATCPICGQPLNEEQKQRILAEVEAQGREETQQIQEEKRNIADLEASMRTIDEQLTKIDEERRKLAKSLEDFVQLRHSVQRGESVTAKYDYLKAELIELQRELREDRFASKEKEERDHILKDIKSVGYDEERERLILGRERELGSAEREYEQLRHASERLSETTQRLAELAETVMAHRANCEQTQQRLQDIQASRARIHIQEQDLQQARSEEEKAQGILQAAHRQLGQIEAAIAEREKDRAERQALAKDRQEAIEQENIASELMDTFGRNGLQALLIEEGIPLIEQEANRLLNHVTDGRMNIQLVTQRLGSAQQTIETLDIRISDEYGLRNYELYSGGEAFRVNFAIRVALSRVLAARAGSPLETLIIDEGFGSQDTTGRLRLQQALASIVHHDEFQCIIVVTHLDELKEAFPYRLEVYKDHQGSHVRDLTYPPLPVGGS